MTLQSVSFAQSADDVVTCDHREWFVATVRPQHELTVADGFKCRGFRQFCPTYEVRRQHQRADRRTLRPVLFPGYVFCQFDRGSRTAVLKTPGVLSIVGFGGTAAVVGDDEIERLQTMASGGSIRPWPYLKSGDRICIEQGPLKGIDGLVVRMQGDWLLVVSISLLQRSVAVIIDRDLIAPVWDRGRSRGLSESRKKVFAANLEAIPESKLQDAYRA